MSDIIRQYKRNSCLSPCAVRGEESLLCVNYKPENDFDVNFPKNDDINGKNGRTCSLNRAEYTVKGHLEYIRGLQTSDGKDYDKEGNPKRTSSFVAKFTDVNQIRAFEVDGKKVLAVWDDPVKACGNVLANPAHASVVSTVKLTKSRISEVRVWFRKLQKENFSFSDALEAYPDKRPKPTFIDMANRTIGCICFVVWATWKNFQSTIQNKLPPSDKINN